MFSARSLSQPAMTKDSDLNGDNFLIYLSILNCIFASFNQYHPSHTVTPDIDDSLFQTRKKKIHGFEFKQ